jgi:hypothetical protein
MALDADAAQHSISAQMALRMAFSVPALIAVFGSRADRPRCFTSIHVRALAARTGRAEFQ